jgi:ComEC/Rec2-related protein
MVKSPTEKNNPIIPKTESKIEILPIFVALFIIGLKISSIIPPSMGVMFFIIALTGIITAKPDMLTPKLLMIILAISAVSSGVFYGIVRIEPNHSKDEIHHLDMAKGTLTGRFKGEFKMLKKGGISFKAEEIIFKTASQTVKIPGKIQCRVKSYDLLPEPEQLYSMTGIFKSNKNMFYPEFICSEMLPMSNQYSPTSLAGKIQRKIRDGLHTLLPHRHASLLIGFLLGDTSLINFKDKKLFRETGISHLLAVSGQHLMIISVILAAILTIINVPPISKSILIIIALSFYGLITPGTPSIWRAIVMYSALAVIFHSEARPSGLRPLSIAAMILLFYNPAYINHAGFLLSFTAVLSILFLRPPFEKMLIKIRLPKFFARYLAVCFAAGLGTMPMTAFLFGTISVVSLIINPSIVWLFSFILPTGVILAVSGALFPSIGLFFSPGLSIVLDMFLKFLEWGNNLPGSYVYVGNIPGIICALTYGLIFIVITLWFNNQEQTASSQVVEKIIIPAPNPPPKAEVAKPKKEEITVSFNIFADQETILDIEEYLAGFPRRSLRNLSNKESVNYPVKNLIIENQTIFYQICDMDSNLLYHETERVFQAQIFCLALLGNELLNRISFHLNPPATPDELSIPFKVKNRHLASAIAADHLLSSSLLTRIKNEQIMMLISRGQALFARGKNQLSKILEEPKLKLIEQHFTLRKDILKWTQDFIAQDQLVRTSTGKK